ncbi:hypothetical protein OSH11_13800 [Kaistia dalseonensis]|uniref:Uncharacterized protein n=1 Tax=Kaistia dalseonensis TaxID=410840 RepID=A0ABU0H7U7_9HYPH|nr:hypothetical protein [Kaistia dalseonensis]MCX5495783.1 hypothetical protein [Kaistia dalseonensis]MDQ0438384.1 hypothetical protein [Kaistia dalseonensis]
MIDPDAETRRPARGAPRLRKPEEITLADLSHGRDLAACLVLRFGEKFLPIFERLDSECTTRERREDMLLRARQVASGVIERRAGASA